MPRGGFAGLVVPAPTDAGAPHEHGFAMLGAPGDFRFTTKVTKGVSGGVPLNPLGGALSSPQRRARRSPQKDSPRGELREAQVCAPLCAG